MSVHTWGVQCQGNSSIYTTCDRAATQHEAMLSNQSTHRKSTIRLFGEGTRVNMFFTYSTHCHMFQFVPFDAHQSTSPYGY